MGIQCLTLVHVHKSLECPLDSTVSIPPCTVEGGDILTTGGLPYPIGRKHLVKGGLYALGIHFSSLTTLTFFPIQLFGTKILAEVAQGLATYHLIAISLQYRVIKPSVFMATKW